MYPSIRARLRPPWPDVLLAAGFTLAMLGTLLHDARSGSGPAVHLIKPGQLSPVTEVPGHTFNDHPGIDPGVLVGYLLLVTGPVAWRRRFPLAVVVLQFVGVFTIHDVDLAGFFAVMTGAYALARHGRWPWLSLATLAVAATLVAASFSRAVPPTPSWVGPYAILLPIGFAGVAIRANRARADAAAGRAALLEQEQAAATRAAVAQERARIARELHDVVSHHVSVMTIQAGAIGKVLDSRPDLARTAATAIETSGREAMGELRHLLGLLTPTGRVPERQPAGVGQRDGLPEEDLLRPQPGLDQIDALVATVRAAGQPVTLRTRHLELPRGVDLAAYRVIQEGLTNALRYAPGAATEIVVDRDEETLTIEVADAGADAVPAPVGTGTGLLGLAERLRLYRGTIETGRRLDGGFRLRARIPLEQP